MDPVTLVVTALSAGAAAGAESALQDGAKDAVSNAYQRLRTLVRKRFAGDPSAELVLVEHEAAPRTWEAPLASKLAGLGIADDSDLLSAARALLALLHDTNTYNVTIRDSRGVQIGNRNVQVNFEDSQITGSPSRP
jgi:RIP homotypic interaction motif